MADPERSGQDDQLGSSKEFHAAFGFIMGLMLTLVGVKYQGSGTTLFKEHSLIVSIFIMVIFVYAIALVNMNLEVPNHHNNSNSFPTYYTHIFLISGTIACELLLYVLVTPLGWFLIINSFGFVFAEVLCLLQPQIDQPLLADHEAAPVANPMWKLYEWFKQVFGRSPNSSTHRTEEEEEEEGIDEAHNTECKLFQPFYDNVYLCSSNRMREWFRKIFGRHVVDEGGGGGVRMVNVV